MFTALPQALLPLSRDTNIEGAGVFGTFEFKKNTRLSWGMQMPIPFVRKTWIFQHKWFHAQKAAAKVSVFGVGVQGQTLRVIQTQGKITAWIRKPGFLR